VLAVGAAHAGKQIPLERMRSIVQSAHLEGKRTVLIGGKTDALVGNSISLDLPDSVINLVGKTSISESAAVIRDAERIYAGDTGMMHLAAALQTPVTSIWGCTRPSLGMEPWRPPVGSQILLPAGKDALRPCSKLGNRCRFNGKSVCMQQHVTEV
jgi:ADP-heptose:LPS heptosyltransferase